MFSRSAERVASEQRHLSEGPVGRLPICHNRELKQPRRKGRRRRQVIAEGLERGRRFWRENET